MTEAPKPLRVAFTSHGRRWCDFLYAYPVISRRSRGLSIGINLNPDLVCNYSCVYCQVDRRQAPRVVHVDLDVLVSELRTLLADPEAIFEQKRFRDVPSEFRQIRDIAFSGDGEPTASPVFPRAARLAAGLREKYRLAEAKLVVFTNACFLDKPEVAATLAFLDQHNGEIWAKLDAGTEGYFTQVNRAGHSLAHVLDNILGAARIRPIVIQSMFMRLHGAPPSEAEIAAYVARLRWLLDSGGQIRLVQAYTVARQTTEPYVAPLSRMELEHIAESVRPLNVPVDCYA